MKKTKVSKLKKYLSKKQRKVVKRRRKLEQWRKNKNRNRKSTGWLESLKQVFKAKQINLPKPEDKKETD